MMDMKRVSIYSLTNIKYPNPISKPTACEFYDKSSVLLRDYEYFILMSQ